MRLTVTKKSEIERDWHLAGHGLQQEIDLSATCTLTMRQAWTIGASSKTVCIICKAGRCTERLQLDRYEALLYVLSCLSLRTGTTRNLDVDKII